MTLAWRHNACSSLLGTRERFTCGMRVSYLWLKTRVWEREKRASALGWNKVEYADPSVCLSPKRPKVWVSIFHLRADALFSLLHTLFFSHSRPTGKPLSCPQKWTARIVTSWDSHLAGGLSNKKARAYYFQTSLDFRSQLYQVKTNSQESVAEGGIDGGGWIWLQSRVDPLKKRQELWKVVLYIMFIQWGLQYQTSSNFDWSIAVLLVYGLVLEWLGFFGAPSCILMYWFLFWMVGSSKLM